jgi:hypothetical protein
VAGVELSGGMTIEDTTTDTSFTGTASVSLVALGADYAADANDPKPISLSAISLDGVFADPGNRFSASVAVTVNNAALFDTLSLLEYESEMWVHDYLMDDLLGVEQLAFNELGIVYLDSASYDAWNNQTCFSGYDEAQTTYTYECLAGDIANVSQFISSEYPEAISVDWPWFRYWSGNTEYNAKLTFPDFETANSYANVTLTVSLDLELVGHPDTNLVIRVNRTELEGGDASLTFIHDGHSIEIEVEKANDADAIGSVTVTNPDGVKLALTQLSDGDSSLSGTLTVNDVQVGTISETDSGVVIIRYDDGTFESLI